MVVPDRFNAGQHRGEIAGKDALRDVFGQFTVADQTTREADREVTARQIGTTLQTGDRLDEDAVGQTGDDLVHGVEAPFPAVSEPLIHIRHYLSRLEDSQHLTAAQHLRVLTRLKSGWYGDRTLPRVVELLDEEGYSQARADVRDFGEHRIKTRDLELFLADRPWRTSN
nr:hypothetical protein [Kribbella catacumbae]